VSKVKLQDRTRLALRHHSAGSGENIKIDARNQIQCSILQGLYGAWAWTAKAT
jgi:TRAP-type uncharacterized transport system substrate-binding protein